MELRLLLREHPDTLANAEPLRFENFTLLGQPIPTISRDMGSVVRCDDGRYNCNSERELEQRLFVGI